MNGLGLEFAFADQDGEQREDFLGAPQGKGGNQDGAAALEHAHNGVAEAFDLGFARRTRAEAGGCPASFP